MPRPTKYSPKVLKLLTKAISVGCTRPRAARLAGIGETTFQEWLESKPGFSGLVQKAEDERTAYLLGIIHKAAVKQWPAAARLLEATTGGEFTRGRTEVTGAGGGPLTLGEVIIRPAEFMDPDAGERARSETAAFFGREHHTNGAKGSH